MHSPQLLGSSLSVSVDSTIFIMTCTYLVLYLYDLALTQNTVPMIHSIHFSYPPIICTLLRLRNILYSSIKDVGTTIQLEFSRRYSLRTGIGLKWIGRYLTAFRPRGCDKLTSPRQNMSSYTKQTTVYGICNTRCKLVNVDWLASLVNRLPTNVGHFQAPIEFP
ncbi:hypothetical protein ARMSODRAFT_540802 [Armillaria solidipes]|uniref:Uncharacterized protein n=1 Tax=Armillaria solidipes TaxID=1076256 RepID=A0A2H3B8L2_9AGAR|nr:hypothetical protein ARMSODRAFT_540802 [Armillaria solidipes]